MGGAGKGVFQALLEAGADVHAKDNVSLLLISSDPCGVESMTQVFSCLCCWICVKCVFFMLAPFFAKSLLRQPQALQHAPVQQGLPQIPIKLMVCPSLAQRCAYLPEPALTGWPHTLSLRG